MAERAINLFRGDNCTMLDGCYGCCCYWNAAGDIKKIEEVAWKTWNNILKQTEVENFRIPTNTHIHPHIPMLEIFLRTSCACYLIKINRQWLYEDVCLWSSNMCCLNTFIALCWHGQMDKKDQDFGGRIRSSECILLYGKHSYTNSTAGQKKIFFQFVRDFRGGQPCILTAVRYICNQVMV